jgi:hypothetical protein
MTLAAYLALTNVINYDRKRCHNLERHLLTTLELPFTIIIFYSICHLMLTSAPRLELSSSCFKAKKVLSGPLLSNIVASKLVA